MHGLAEMQYAPVVEEASKSCFGAAGSGNCRGGLAALVADAEHSAAHNGAAASAPSRMLRVEVGGLLHDWFDVDEMGDFVRSPAFPSTLRENIARFFGVPVDQQAIYDEDGLLTTNADFSRALQRVSPMFYIYNVDEMGADLMEKTVEELEMIDNEVKSWKQMRVRCGKGQIAPTKKVDGMENGRLGGEGTYAEGGSGGTPNGTPPTAATYAHAADQQAAIYAQRPVQPSMRQDSAKVSGSVVTLGGSVQAQAAEAAQAAHAARAPRPDPVRASTSPHAALEAAYAVAAANAAASQAPHQGTALPQRNQSSARQQQQQQQQQEQHQRHQQQPSPQPSPQTLRKTDGPTQLAPYGGGVAGTFHVGRSDSAPFIPTLPLGQQSMSGNATLAQLSSRSGVSSKVTVAAPTVESADAWPHGVKSYARILPPDEAGSWPISARGGGGASSSTPPVPASFGPGPAWRLAGGGETSAGQLPAGGQWASQALAAVANGPQFGGGAQSPGPPGAWTAAAAFGMHSARSSSQLLRPGSASTTALLGRSHSRGAATPRASTPVVTPRRSSAPVHVAVECVGVSQASDHVRAATPRRGAHGAHGVATPVHPSLLGAPTGAATPPGALGPPAGIAFGVTTAAVSQYGYGQQMLAPAGYAQLPGISPSPLACFGAAMDGAFQHVGPLWGGIGAVGGSFGVFGAQGAEVFRAANATSLWPGRPGTSPHFA